jgi:hypothetical protein
MALTAREDDGGPPAGASRLLAAAAYAAREADARVSAALNDLFVPERHRPNDRQRSAISVMIEALVEDLESDLRLGLIERLGDAAPPAIGVARIAIARPIFDRAGVLRERDLVALLLARAEEHRIAEGIRRIAAADPEPASTVPLNIAPELEMPYLIAESRRSDGAGEPTLSARDLPADLLVRLAWWTAAALRDYLDRASPLDPAARDESLQGAVFERLAAHDESQTLEGAAMRVALAGPADDDALFEAFRRGYFSLFVANLAVRARIDYMSAFVIATDPGIGALAVALRAIEARTEVAASILLQMAAINGLSEAKLEERINDYLDLDLIEAREAIRPWRLDRAFRAAIADIGRERRAR